MSELSGRLAESTQKARSAAQNQDRVSRGLTEAAARSDAVDPAALTCSCLSSTDQRAPGALAQSPF